MSTNMGDIDHDELRSLVKETIKDSLHFNVITDEVYYHGHAGEYSKEVKTLQIWLDYELIGEVGI